MVFLTLKFFALEVQFFFPLKRQKIGKGRIKMTIKVMEQSIFILKQTGTNLDPNLIVFTVERLVK